MNPAPPVLAACNADHRGRQQVVKSGGASSRMSRDFAIGVAFDTGSRAIQ